MVISDITWRIGKLFQLLSNLEVGTLRTYNGLGSLSDRRVCGSYRWGMEFGAGSLHINILKIDLWRTASELEISLSLELHIS